MRIRGFVLLLAISTVSTFAADTYKFGRIAKITAPKLEPGDSAPMFCTIEITSPGVIYSFTMENRQVRNCDRRWVLHQGIWFRIVDQHIFIKQPKAPDAEGRLTERRFEIRTFSPN
jgi:hypothetical protein